LTIPRKMYFTIGRGPHHCHLQPSAKSNGTPRGNALLPSDFANLPIPLSRIASRCDDKAAAAELGQNVTSCAMGGSVTALIGRKWWSNGVGTEPWRYWLRCAHKVLEICSPGPRLQIRALLPAQLRNPAVDYAPRLRRRQVTIKRTHFVFAGSFADLSLGVSPRAIFASKM
jgi:hypothetical protein